MQFDASTVVEIVDDRLKRDAASPVLLQVLKMPAEPDDSLLLGVIALEKMGLLFDPLKRTLSAMEIRM